jgi:hypothetical protein
MVYGKRCELSGREFFPETFPTYASYPVNHLARVRDRDCCIFSRKPSPEVSGVEKECPRSNF